MKIKNILLFSGLLTLILAGGTFFQSANAQTTVCKGESLCLTIGSHRGDVQWQNSPDNLNWSDIPGGTNDTFCVTVDTLGYYRAMVTEGSCDPIYTLPQMVMVSEVWADAGADSTYCKGAAFMLGGSPTGSGGIGTLSYHWTPTGSVSDSTASNPMGSVQVPTTFVVTVTDSIGCMAMDSIFIDTLSGAVSGVDSFAYTGAMQMFIVPGCVDSITAEVYGAQGGANWVNNDNFGGLVTGTFAVNEGDTLYLYVGQQPNGITGGWNGGGNGESAGQGGGGASDVRVGGTTLNDRIVVAGGGGGAGYWSSSHVVGGGGGGLTGGDGYRTSPSTAGGQGGTQTSSGTGTCVSFNNPSVSGGFGYGGSPSGCGCEGYGGGGGWYGGAGSGNCRGGGGGSGYTDPAVSNVSHAVGVHPGNGKIILRW